MENGAILDSQITASTEFSPSHAPRMARLNFQASQGSWSALVSDVNQWLQVDFLHNVTLSKVATQGRHHYPQWVLSYLLSYSMDGSAFENYKQCGEDKVSFTLYRIHNWKRMKAWGRDYPCERSEDHLGEQRHDAQTQELVCVFCVRVKLRSSALGVKFANTKRENPS